MINDTDFERISHAVTGELSPEQQVSYRTWVALDDQRSAVHAELSEVWKLAKDIGPSIDMEEALQRVYASVREHKTTDEQARMIRDGNRATQGRTHVLEATPQARLFLGLPSRWLPQGIGFATIVCSVMMFAWRTVAVDPGVTRTYTTQTGQRATLALGNGLRITLGPRTTLRLDGFGQDNRTVALDGEAYFDVPRADGTPFVVRTGNVMTRVLGTTFVVRRYHDDRAVRVAVVSGRVSVTTAAPRRPSVTLAAGNVGDIWDSTVTVRTVDSLDGETEWLRDELVFNNTPVTEVLKALTRWYGYEFRYTDTALVRQNVTAWVSTTSLAKALSTLKQVLNVRVSAVGDTVTLVSQYERSGSGRSERREKREDLWKPSREVGR